MRRCELSRACLCLAAALGLGIAAYILSSLLLCGSYFVHETGHVLGGTLSELRTGMPSDISISNEIACPLPGLSWLNLPQQTRGPDTPFFHFGGTGLVMVFSLLLASIAFALTKNRLLSLGFPVLLLLYELVGNVFCGTDNLTGQPLVACDGTFLFSYFASITFWGLLLLIWVSSVMWAWRKLRGD